MPDAGGAGSPTRVVNPNQNMARLKNPESLPNIRRIDTPPGRKRQTHGFQVHVMRQFTEHTKHFSDSLYGSKDEARAAAVFYRDGLLDRLPFSYKQLGYNTVSNSNTGHCGISHTRQPSGKVKQKLLPCFSASVRSANGQVENTYFYYDPDAPGRYEAALDQAVCWREAKLKQRLRDMKMAKK
jgi:hypothetical protein